MVNKLKVLNQVTTAAMLTIAVSLFLGVSSKGKSSFLLEASQITGQPTQVSSQFIPNFN